MRRNLCRNGAMAGLLCWGVTAAVGQSVELSTADRKIALEPESVTWRLGPFSRSGATTKARLTARAMAPRRPVALDGSRLELVITGTKPSSALRCELLRGDANANHREFDVEFTWRGGQRSWAASKSARVERADCEATAEGARLDLTSLPQGVYGLLVAATVEDAVPADRIYSFSKAPVGRGGSDDATASGVGLPDRSSIYIDAEGRSLELKPEQFEWYPDSGLNRFKAIAKRIPFAREDPRSREYEKFVSWRRMNGDLSGETSIPVVARGAQVGILVARGASIAEFRLVKIERSGSSRQIRLDTLYINDTYLGVGKFAMSPGPEPLPYEAVRIGPGKYSVDIRSLKAGQYAFLAPGTPALGKVGVAYAFSVN